MDTWHDASTICFGLILTRRVNLTDFHSSQFSPPFDDGFSVWMRYNDINKVINVISNNLYEASLTAASTVSDANEVDWPKYLLKISRAYQVGNMAESIGKSLKLGREIDSARIIALAENIRNLANPDAIGLINGKEIDISNFSPFIETGWAAIDENIGGISASAPTLVGGMTGLGKTTFAMKMALKFLQRWPQSVVAFYSLEMGLRAWKYKFLKLFPSAEAYINGGRLLVSSSAVTASDIGLETSSANVDLTIIDDLNHLVRRDTPEDYAQVNKILNEICRTREKPMLVISHFNATRYSEPLPTMKSFAYGTTSNNAAGLVLTLARFTDDESTGGAFAYMPDYPMAILVWKSRDGWIKQIGPGGIFLPEVKNLWSDDAGIWQVYGQAQKHHKTIRRKE